MPTSAGIVLFRCRHDDVEVLLGHMGGPYWAAREAGAWTIPKGEHEPEEDALAAACREFAEETGVPVPATQFVDLGTVRQSGGKLVRAWAAELSEGTDLDPASLVSSTFEIEWPPRSGRLQRFPELDRIAWFDLGSAGELVVGAQRALLDRLSSHLRGDGP